jgi:hypothetical protein
MVHSVAKNPVIKAQIGDVTDCGLPDNLVDFVVATRIVEYLFWPNHLANEIKRIGKLGGKYLLSFPAARKSSVFVGHTPPDLIRRYFTTQEIDSWTRQIGSGQLIGIFKDEEAEAGAQVEPTNFEVHNWIFIGTIEDKNPASSALRMRVVALSEFAFELRDKERDAYVKSFGKYIPAPVRKVVRKLPYFKNL